MENMNILEDLLEIYVLIIEMQRETCNSPRISTRILLTNPKSRYL